MTTTMREIGVHLHTRALHVGDRIAVWQARQTMRSLIGQAGTVVEIFYAPRGSCLVRLDNADDHHQEWFFYRDEVRFSDE